MKSRNYHTWHLVIMFTPLLLLGFLAAVKAMTSKDLIRLQNAFSITDIRLTTENGKSKPHLSDSTGEPMVSMCNCLSRM